MIEPRFLPQDQGWYLPDELEWLHAQAKHAASRGLMLEVGCYRGLSTSAIASAGPVVVVDDFRGAPPDYRPNGAELRAAFVSNMEGLGLMDNVVLIEGRSADVLPSIHGSFSLVHLDADHGAGTTEEMRQCYRLTARGGILVLDDVDWPEVGHAALDLFGASLFHVDKKVGFVRRPA